MSAVAERIPDPGLGSTSEGAGFRADSMHTSQADLDAVMREFEAAENDQATEDGREGGAAAILSGHELSKVTAPGKTAPAPKTIAKPADEPEPEAAVDPDAEPAPPVETAQDDKPKVGEPNHKGTRRLDAIQQRIANATSQKHTLDNDIAQRRAMLEQLDRDIASRRQPDAPAAPATSALPPQADDPKPRWTGPKGYEAQGKDFQTYEDDVEAWEARRGQRAEAAAKAEAEARQRDEDQRASQQIRARHEQRVTDLMGKDAEFAAAIKSDEFIDIPRTSLMTTIITRHDRGLDLLRHIALNPADGYAFSELPQSEAMVEAFRVSEDPVRLFAALANDPEKAGQIARMSGSQALRALWALESSPTAEKVGTTPGARPSVASPLPAKVQASRSTAPKRQTNDLSTDDFDEFADRES